MAVSEPPVPSRSELHPPVGRPRATLLRWLLVLLLVLLGLFQALQLQLSDDALDLLPGEAVRGDLALLQRLGLVDRLFLTLTVDPAYYPSTAEARTALQQGVEQAGRAMAASELLVEVFYRLPPDLARNLPRELQPYLPVLLERQDLAELASRLDEEGLARIMEDNFNLLNSPAGMVVKRQVQHDPLGLLPLVLPKFSRLQQEHDGAMVDGFFLSEDRRSALILAESTRSLTNSQGAAEVAGLLQAIMADHLPSGVDWGVVGSLPHTLANYQAVQRDLRLLLPVASVLLLTMLLLTLRDARVLLVLAIPFLAAPVAIAVMGLVHGRVSALALGFGIVLIGVAVDFAVHIYLFLAREEGEPHAMLRRLLRPVSLATLTTAGVFVVLLFSQVPSHRQMATLAFTGILLAVVFSWLLLPTLIDRRPRQPAKWFTPPVVSAWTHRLLVLGLWGALLVGGLLSWPALQYTGNLRVLDAPDDQVLAAEKHFRATWGREGELAFVVAAGATLAEAQEHNFTVYRYLQQHDWPRWQSVAPLLPGPAVQRQRLADWQAFWAARGEDFPERFRQAAGQAGFAPGVFDSFLEWLTTQPGLLEAGTMLAGPLRPLVSMMVRKPEQQGNDRQTAEFLLLTTVELTESHRLPELLALADGHSAITVLANQKWRQQVERLLRHDLAVLTSAAALLLLLLAVLFFRRPRTVLAVLAPVLSALAAMVLFSRLTGGELNMMHLLMGIMVIGLSVDYGIFVVCARGERRSSTTLLAVSICAASSMISFGVLAFAQHPALHSLGITVLWGIGAAWPTALLVSPVLAGNALPAGVAARQPKEEL
ncbi:MAG: MMPL family transporter [Desulfurivibrio sp.]|nr:MMPL family transporter [Desulfurivibrio sp.]